MIPGGTARWVGEEGPELIVPTQQSKVYNARQLAFAGGGGTVHNYSPVTNITMQAGSDPRETEQRMLAAMKINNERQKQEIFGTLNRNGFGRLRP